MNKINNDKEVKHSWLIESDDKGIHEELKIKLKFNNVKGKEDTKGFGSNPAIREVKGSEIIINNEDPILPLSVPMILERLPRYKGREVKEDR